MEYEIKTGNCVDVMRGMDADSVDTIITSLPTGVLETTVGMVKFGAHPNVMVEEKKTLLLTNGMSMKDLPRTVVRTTIHFNLNRHIGSLKSRLTVSIVIRGLVS